MDENILRFFSENMDALPLYEELEHKIFSEMEEVTVKVSKTQISFSNKYMFACASFARVRKKKDLPKPYLTVTFGLDYRADSPRIDVATEPYPGRWTHHVVVAEPEEIDEELMGFIREAAAYSARKR